MHVLSPVSMVLRNSVHLQINLFSGLHTHGPCVLKQIGAMVVKAFAEIDGAEPEKATMAPLETKYESLSIKELPRKRLVRKRQLRKEGRWPLMTSNNITFIASFIPLIMEYLVKICKKVRILELKRRHLKITVLTSNTPILFDESDDEDYTVIFDKNSFSYKIISVNDLKTDSENDNEKVNMPSFPLLEPTVSCFDDLDFFKDFENEFPAIVYNDALTSKSNLLTEPTLSPQHIDEFDLKDETSLSEYDEVEQNVCTLMIYSLST
ncbi:hypothetical protein Tco_0304565 [Tanacetum coccineum]